MIKFLDLNLINRKCYSNFKKKLDRNFNDSRFILSQYNEKFENNFKKFISSKHCACVGNGTDALEIAIEALNLKKGSEVIVPANTFVATAEAVIRNNLKIKFCDIDSNYLGFDTKKLEEKISSNTSAIIVVHLYGIPDKMIEILKICKKYNLKLIEDCSQANGSKFMNKSVGNFGDISTFSFFPGKILGGIGDGGACATNNTKLYTRIKKIRNHGRLKKFDHEIVGRNSRLDSLNAIFLDLKLKYLKKEIEFRTEQAELYYKSLKENKFIFFPTYSIQDTISFCYFPIFIKKKRKSLINYLTKFKIETQMHYPFIVPELRAFKEKNIKVKYLNSYKISKMTLSLPIGSHLNSKDIIYISNKINNFFY